MQGALISTWTRPRDGMLKQALEFSAQVSDWWGQRAAEGKCTQPEMFFSLTRGHGMWMVKGDLDVLHELERRVEVQHLLIKSALLLEGFSYDIEFTGAAADEYVGRVVTAATELGLV